MHFNRSLQDDIETIEDTPESSFVTGKDNHGRLVVFTNKTQLDFSQHNLMFVMQYAWYQFHLHLKNLKVQNCGSIGVGQFRINSPTQFDTVQTKISATLIQDVLPINMVCLHICHAPTFFNNLFPIYKFIIENKIRLCTETHSGSEEKVLKVLEHYGIQCSFILKSMGEGNDLKIEEWPIFWQEAEAAHEQF